MIRLLRRVLRYRYCLTCERRLTRRHAEHHLRNADHRLIA